MKKIEEFLKDYEEAKKEKIELILLEINMPTGETEIIQNPNVDAKVEYIKKAYDENLVHKNCKDIYIQGYLFLKKEDIITVNKNTVTQEEIDKLIEEAEIDVKTIYDKCTVVTVRLKNGFIITENSACVSAENYNEDIGKEICMDNIKNKLWELEGYKLQCELNR